MLRTPFVQLTQMLFVFDGGGRLVLLRRQFQHETVHGRVSHRVGRVCASATAQDGRAQRRRQIVGQHRVSLVWLERQLGKARNNQSRLFASVQRVHRVQSGREEYLSKFNISNMLVLI